VKFMKTIFRGGAQAIKFLQPLVCKNCGCASVTVNNTL
jgi:hypothetical protein